MPDLTRAPAPAGRVKLLLFANTEWYLFNFRLALAKAARAQGAEVVLVSPPGPYGERLRAEGFRWVPVPMARRSLNPIREFFMLVALWRLYRDERPNIAHHFTTKCVVYGALVAKAAGTRAVVNSLTGMGYVFSSNQLLARILKPAVWQLLRLAVNGGKSRLIVQNPDDRRAVVESNLVPDSQIRLIAGSGVDIERYRPRPAALGQNAHAPVVLFAARLLWDKGVGEFVNAARALRAEGIRLEFLIAGGPDEGNPACVPQQQLAAWRDEGVVTLLGHVHDMPALMARVDVAVLPSYREGLPRSLIEAAAAGLPIVTTDAPGCRDVVDDGVNGMLVPIGDSDALAAAIRKIALDHDLALRMGAASRKKALAEFDERIVLAKTLAAYRELLPEWRSGDVSCADSPAGVSDTRPVHLPEVRNAPSARA